MITRDPESGTIEEACYFRQTPSKRLALAASVHSNWDAPRPVIKDSEAVRYVGKYVEVRGLVGSVTTSPLGTVFINFGRDYPDQTFAGFIAAGSKIATDQWIAGLQGKIIRIYGRTIRDPGAPARILPHPLFSRTLR